MDHALATTNAVVPMAGLELTVTLLLALDTRTPIQTPAPVEEHVTI